MSIARFSLGFWLLAAVFAATIGAKVATARQRVATDQASVAVERRHIVDWLRRQHFSIGMPPISGMAVVEARGDGCRMTIVAVDARGIHRELLSAMRPVGADLFFVYQGVPYLEQPVGRTMLAHHLWARSRDVGIRLPRPLVLGVVRSGCSGHATPWAELAAIP